MPQDPALIRALYRSMMRLRKFESKLQEVYRSGVMPGFIHLYLGEEAVAAGVCAHLRKDDYVTSTHRGHGHALAKGIPMGAVFAEVWGQTRGSNGGRGGSMHIYEPDCGFLGTNGIVAAGIPIGAGAGLAAQLRNAGQVAVTFFGDGAVNNCAFHEGINLAAVWDLPVVFVCENNMYATEMPFEKATRNTNVASRGAAYGIPGVRVDGNDVLAVYEAAGEAVARARSGHGPTLLECATYRTVGHFEGDPGIGYRTREEIAEWKGRDPIKRLRERCLSAGDVKAEELDAIEREVGQEVAEAYEYAKASPPAEPATVTNHVYVQAVATGESEHA
ncbi:MAG TPA: thiamine pyrophosphate-dependent dehydrogenase E1 component subunit alpha [Bryobacteraceae bacterium]|nr:thiamine pyrophosphate-dependent dehydrogenase E1 component subunit alpha [Bryobacteraceae bacterium]